MVSKENKMYFLRYIGFMGIFSFLYNSLFCIFLFNIPLYLKNYSEIYPYLDSPASILYDIVNSKISIFLSIIYVIFTLG